MAEYQPTKNEAPFEGRKASRRGPLPEIASSFEVTESCQQDARLKLDHQDEDTGYELIAESVASEHPHFTVAMMQAGAQIGRTPTGVRAGAVIFALTFVAGLSRQDQLDATLGCRWQLSTAPHSSLNTLLHPALCRSLSCPSSPAFWSAAVAAIRSYPRRRRAPAG
jgi:hypothetical protein